MSLCTVDLEIPNSLAQALTVALLSTIYLPRITALSSSWLELFKKNHSNSKNILLTMYEKISKKMPNG